MGSNAELIEGAYAAFSRGDIPAVIDLVDDQVDWRSPTTLPHGGQFKGKAGVGEFFQGIGAAWSDLAVSLESLSEAGADTVVTVIQADGTLRSGDPGHYGAAHVFTVANGKIVSFKEYVDLDAQLR